MPRVAVVGSINVDVVAQSQRMPLPGETVFGEAVAMLPGGKGANQAVAAHRLGMSVLLAGAVGDDDFSRFSLNFLGSEGIDTSFISREADCPTGTAVILLDSAGENSIVIIPGANSHVWQTRVPDLLLDESDILLLQNEVPESTNVAALKQAVASQARSVLNLAPYRDTHQDLLHMVDYLVVNENEYAGLLGIDPTGLMPHRITGLLAEGAGVAKNIVVTLGALGLVARIGDEVLTIAGHEVVVVDTTGAGDCFCGAFGVALAEGQDARLALAFANAAAALSVQRLGASPSMPSMDEVQDLLGSVTPK